MYYTVLCISCAVPAKCLTTIRNCGRVHACIYICTHTFTWGARLSNQLAEISLCLQLQGQQDLLVSPHIPCLEPAGTAVLEKLQPQSLLQTMVLRKVLTCCEGMVDPCAAIPAPCRGRCKISRCASFQHQIHVLVQRWSDCANTPHGATHMRLQACTGISSQLLQREHEASFLMTALQPSLFVYQNDKGDMQQRLERDPSRR